MSEKPTTEPVIGEAVRADPSSSENDTVPTMVAFSGEVWEVFRARYLDSSPIRGLNSFMDGGSHDRA